MKLSNLKIGILHSLIGKNDGVSIVIDQSVTAMVESLGVSMENIFFLTAHSSIKFNTTMDSVFWHKNNINKYILKNFSKEPVPKDLEETIIHNAYKAKELIKKWVEEHDLDLLIAHNSCHPSNFIYAVGLALYFEEIRKQNKIRPRYLLWWHDSHYERERFQSPNEVVAKYQQYIPGPSVDGIIFINSTQEQYAREYYKQVRGEAGIDYFFDKKTITIPNTSDVPDDWDFKSPDDAFYPKLDEFNESFLKDIGVLSLIKKQGYTTDDMVLFLQHTRIVKRKKIEYAIDFVFEMAKKYKTENQKKILILIVSGHGRDEHDEYHVSLKHYFEEKEAEKGNEDLKVFIKFAEDRVLPHREIVVEKKFYSFSEVPGIIANYNSMGTYFSECEGYGNNLLEMISVGLPVVINEYPIYKSDIKDLGFYLPSAENGNMTQELIDEGYELLNNPQRRLFITRHNLRVLREKLNHEVLSDSLSKLIENVFTYT
jgi:mannosylglucosylglycerate synthase